MSGLVVAGLRARHGRTAVLDGLDVSVEDGALACVLGPSGCGKTTLLRVIAGFHRPDSGHVTVAGRILDDAGTHVAAERRRIGFVPQHGALFPHLTVAANIGFGVRRRQRAERVADMLAMVDLDGFGDRYPHQLSGGQQQRVALARALAPGPELVLLDEPFASLDSALRAEVRDEVAALLRLAGATAILVTHDQEEALTFADTIAVMRAGRIVQAGPSEDVYRRPVDAGVARFLGEANIVAAQRSARHAGFGAGTVAIAEPRSGSAQGAIVVRPRQLRLLPITPDTDGVRARIVGQQFRGHDYRVELEPQPEYNLPAPLIAYADTTPPPTGTTVALEIHGPVHFLTAESPDERNQPPVDDSRTRLDEASASQ
jgi:iron(III) transport system ATP-binding protein